MVPLDPEYAEQDRDLPRRGAAHLRRRVRRLVARPASSPRCGATSTISRACSTSRTSSRSCELACLLEDAIDMHDRHWKIHWMLNFAQLSATLNLRAVMEKTHGKIDEALLGRLQNSAKDRNWDSIEALWKMKEEAKGRLPSWRRVQARDRRRDHRRPQGDGPRAARSSPSGSAVPEGVRLARGLEPRVHLPDRLRAHGAGDRARSRLHRDRTTTTRRRSAALAADIEAAAKEILEGLEGEALEEMRAANEINLKMAPAHAGPSLLHRPGRQRARAPGAHRDRQEARRPGRARRRRTT